MTGDGYAAFVRFCEDVHEDVGQDFGPHPVGITYGVAVTSCTLDNLQQLRHEVALLLEARQHDHAARIAAQHATWTIIRADHARADLARVLYAIEQAIADSQSADASNRKRRAGPGRASRIRAVIRGAPASSA